MAFQTAFQSDAFQTNAFQIAEVPPPVLDPLLIDGKKDSENKKWREAKEKADREDRKRAVYEAFHGKPEEIEARAIAEHEAAAAEARAFAEAETRRQSAIGQVQGAMLDRRAQEIEMKRKQDEDAMAVLLMVT